MAPAVLLVVLLAVCLAPGKASRGDASSDFKMCVNSCAHLNCSGAKEIGLSPVLRALFWTCRENCEYVCMHEVTALDVKRGRKVRQFHGKWPFVRLLGVQEPASTAFSVLNWLTTTVSYLWFSHNAPADFPYRTVLAMHAVTAANAWLWSTVFHSRDTYWTEKLDYFSAAAFIVCGIIVQFVRITGPEHVLWHACYLLLWAGLFSAHVYYLTFVHFDYGYNMAASVGAGAFYTMVWCVWCAGHWRKRRYLWKCLATVVATNVLVLLELLDFPPLWWTFDAHSLWHLSTVPLPVLWYSFWIDDAKFEGQFKKIV